jgi:hypothetical protein
MEMKQRGTMKIVPRFFVRGTHENVRQRTLMCAQRKLLCAALAKA